MSGLNIRLNDVVIKQPLDFEMSWFNLTKSDRVASGDMVMDFIAKKRKFQFSYDVMSGVERKVIFDIINTNVMFFTIKYVDDMTLVDSQATVYVGEITHKRFRTDGVWYWKDVKFNLIER